MRNIQFNLFNQKIIIKKIIYYSGNIVVYSQKKWEENSVTSEPLYIYRKFWSPFISKSITNTNMVHSELHKYTPRNRATISTCQGNASWEKVLKSEDTSDEHIIGLQPENGERWPSLSRYQTSKPTTSDS